MGQYFVIEDFFLNNKPNVESFQTSLSKKESRHFSHNYLKGISFM